MKFNGIKMTTTTTTTLAHIPRDVWLYIFDQMLSAKWMRDLGTSLADVLVLRRVCQWFRNVLFFDDNTRDWLRLLVPSKDTTAAWPCALVERCSLFNSMPHILTTKYGCKQYLFYSICNIEPHSVHNFTLTYKRHKYLDATSQILSITVPVALESNQSTFKTTQYIILPIDQTATTTQYQCHAYWSSTLLPTLIITDVFNKSNVLCNVNWGCGGTFLSHKTPPTISFKLSFTLDYPLFVHEQWSSNVWDR